MRLSSSSGSSLLRAGTSPPAPRRILSKLVDSESEKRGRKTNMAFSLSTFNTSVTLRSSSSFTERSFTGGQCKPPLNLLLQRSSIGSSSSAAYARRRRSQNSAVTSLSKRKKDEQVKGDDIGEDKVDALFKKSDSSQLDEEDDYDEISEEDLQRLQQELEEAFGVDGDEVGDYDMEKLSSSKDDSSEDVDEDRPLKLKNWQFRRLAVALKKGRRNISIKNLAGDLCLERGIVLELLRNPSPSLVMMSAGLPDEPEPVLLPVRHLKPIEAEIEETPTEEPAVKDESKVKLPVHVMFQNWNAQKRLKKVHAQTLERVYRRTKRPTNTMVSSIVHVTNLPRKKVVQWFEDKRTEEGVPEKRLPYRRSIHETASSS
ncbi:Protein OVEREXPRESSOR OF CATIONIC PEROXIDASE 3 [Linum perenne]